MEESLAVDAFGVVDGLRAQHQRLRGPDFGVHLHRFTAGLVDSPKSGRAALRVWRQKDQSVVAGLHHSGEGRSAFPWERTHQVGVARVA